MITELCISAQHNCKNWCFIHVWHWINSLQCFQAEGHELLHAGIITLPPWARWMSHFQGGNCHGVNYREFRGRTVIPHEVESLISPGWPHQPTQHHHTITWLLIGQEMPPALRWLLVLSLPTAAGYSTSLQVRKLMEGLWTAHGPSKAKALTPESLNQGRRTLGTRGKRGKVFPEEV